jgi:hypothetical protein
MARRRRHWPLSPAVLLVVLAAGGLVLFGHRAQTARAQDGPRFVFDVQLLQHTPLRAQPDPRAAVVAQLEEGDVVTVISRERGTDGVLWFGVAAGPGAVAGWLPQRAVIVIQTVELPD